MRKWSAPRSTSPSAPYTHVLADMIGQLGQARFGPAVLASLHSLLPAASISVYQTGPHCNPHLFFSGSFGVPDTTRACWQAYLSGPHQADRTLLADATELQRQDGPMLCHITAQEVPAQHRHRVYEAHGVAERVSVVQQDAQSLLAVNLYRHQHQRPFDDRQVADFEVLAPALLALVQKQISLAPPSPERLTPVARGSAGGGHTRWHLPLRRLSPALTAREIDVCARLLAGMTQDGIASDLGLSLPTVKTYRNRAFARLGIHFRNELFALMLPV